MSAALVSAIRDFSGICKVLQSTKQTELHQQMLELEKHIQEQFGLRKIQTWTRGSTAQQQQQQNLQALTSSLSIPTTKNNTNNCNHRKLDRSVSEPLSQQQQQPRPVQPNSSRYKTELCRPFEENGTCKYGDKCQFAHGINDLRTLARHPKYKTELCRTFHTTGFCPYGPRCHFIHNDVGKNMAHSPTLRPSSNDFDIGSFNVNVGLSNGELSPNSSVSGSPPSSTNGFFLDENSFSPPPPQTAPPFITNSGFFGQDFGRQQQHDSNAIGMLSTSVDNLNLRDTSGPLYDINRNLRLPIFSRFGALDAAS